MFHLTELSACAKLNLNGIVCLAAKFNQPSAGIYDIIPGGSQSPIPPEMRFTQRTKAVTFSSISAPPARNQVDGPSTSDNQYK